MRDKASDTKMTSRELHDLIALGEGAELEFKQSFPSDLGREICAMANAIGGRILIGVDDNGRIVGTLFTNRIRSEIQNLARNIVPPVPISIFSRDGVVVIGVPESRNKPHASNGKFYLRDGANTQSMNRDELREFFFREGQLYFDEMPNRKFKVSESISQDKYRMFVRESGIPESLPMMDALRNLKVLDGAVMTNAGTLVFGDHGSDYLISATITCALFQGADKVKILDKKIFDDDIYTNYHSVLAYLLAHLDTEYIIGIRRVDKLELPVVALREAVVNAIAHRNYSSAANIQIYIFKDRVEIVNPGGLVAGMRKEDLGTKSLPRNPLLFNLMHRMRIVENIGSGFKRIHEAATEYGMPDPIIEADKNWFSLTFPRPEKI